MDLASKLFKGDRVIWIIFMFLCLIGGGGVQRDQYDRL